MDKKKEENNTTIIPLMLPTNTIFKYISYVHFFLFL